MLSLPAWCSGPILVTSSCSPISDRPPKVKLSILKVEIQEWKIVRQCLWVLCSFSWGTWRRRWLESRFGAKSRTHPLILEEIYCKAVSTSTRNRSWNATNRLSAYRETNGDVYYAISTCCGMTPIWHCQLAPTHWRWATLQSAKCRPRHPPVCWIEFQTSEKVN